MENTPPEARLGHKVKRISNTFDRMVNHTLSRWDITASQSAILVWLTFQEGVKPCQHDIERRFGIKHPTATGILRRLEKKGFVSFEPDEFDGRLKRVIITDEGRNVVESTKQALDATDDSLSSALTPEELAELHRLLDKLVDKIAQEKILKRKDDKD